MRAETGPLNVILLPGGVLPAALAYGALIDALGTAAACVPKDLEIYAGDRPPADYSLDLEIGGVLQTADEAGFDRFHLVGYSAGGLAALAAAAGHPHRVAGLGLFEFAPVQALDPTPEGEAVWQGIERMLSLPPEERARANAAMLLKPGARPPAPPTGPPPPWMVKRPAAMEHLLRTWFYPLDLHALARYEGAVYLALGTDSHQEFERQGRRLAEIVPQTEIETYDGLHHLKPAHLAEPARMAESLLRAWSKAGAGPVIS